MLVRTQRLGEDARLDVEKRLINVIHKYRIVIVNILYIMLLLLLLLLILLLTIINVIGIISILLLL